MLWSLGLLLVRFSPEGKQCVSEMKMKTGGHENRAWSLAN